MSTPRDKDGLKVKEGDLVVVLCRVEKLFEEGPHPNVQLRTLVPMHAHEDGTVLTLMSRQLLVATDARVAAAFAEPLASASGALAPEPGSPSTESEKAR